MLVLISTCCWY